MTKRQPHHLRDALGALVAGGVLSEGVRPEIAASWHRSIASNLNPDRFDVPYEPDVADQGQLYAAAQPVVRRLADDLSSSSMSLLVADKQGHVVERSVDDGRLRCVSTGSCSRRGFYIERIA